MGSSTSIMCNVNFAKSKMSHWVYFNKLEVQRVMDAIFSCRFHKSIPLFLLILRPMKVNKKMPPLCYERTFSRIMRSIIRYASWEPGCPDWLHRRVFDLWETSCWLGLFSFVTGCTVLKSRAHNSLTNWLVVLLWRGEMRFMRRAECNAQTVGQKLWWIALSIFMQHGWTLTCKTMFYTVFVLLPYVHFVLGVSS